MVQNHRQGNWTLGFLSLLVLWSLAGCVSKSLPPAEAETSARKYLQALRAGDNKTAAGLLSVRATQALASAPLPDYVKSQGPDHPPELGPISKIQHRASIVSPNGDNIHLVEEGGIWKLDSGPWVPAPGFSPDNTMDLFLRALQSRDCQALVSCAPPGVRRRHLRQELVDGCEKKMASFQGWVDKLGASKRSFESLAPNRLALPFGDSGKVILVRIQGRWYIETL